MAIAAQSVWEFGQADNATGCRDSLAKASQQLKKCFFVHVNKQTVSLFVMVHTTKSNIEIKNMLTTFKL